MCKVEDSSPPSLEYDDPFFLNELVLCIPGRHGGDKHVCECASGHYLGGIF